MKFPGYLLNARNEETFNELISARKTSRFQSRTSKDSNNDDEKRLGSPSLSLAIFLPEFPANKGVTEVEGTFSIRPRNGR